MLYKKTIEEVRKKGFTNVPNGTLKKLVNDEEEKAGLSINSISLDTIRSRVKRGNPEAYCESKLSPIRDLEPLLLLLQPLSTRLRFSLVLLFNARKCCSFSIGNVAAVILLFNVKKLLNKEVVNQHRCCKL